MTKTFDSTISQIPQDDSSVEYVDAQKNPLTTIQNSDLIFGQKHNDIDCALCPSAKRACDRAWVTAKNLEEWSSMSTTTLWRWLGRLEKARRISSFSDMKKTPILAIEVRIATIRKPRFSYLKNVASFFYSWCCFRYTIQPVL